MKVKFIYIVLLLMLSIPFQSIAQENEYKTLFGGEEDSFGGYFGLNSHYTKINGQDALLLGGEASAILNHSFSIGIKGYGMVTSNESNNFTDLGEQLYIAMGYGGLTIEPILFYNSAVHLSLPILMGAGGIAEYSKNNYHDYEHYNFDHYNSDYFFLLEPGVNVEINVLKFMQISSGVSYRITSDIDMTGLNSNDLNGFNFDLSLKFGWF